MPIRVISSERIPIAAHQLRFNIALTSLQHRSAPCLTTTTLKTAITIPAKRIARSAAVPAPTVGGILNSPVRNDATPVATSARTNGNDVIMNAFATAIPSFPPFHGLLLEDQTPATSRMAAKIAATTGL